MKNNIKIWSIVILFVFITTATHNTVFAKTKINTIQPTGNFAMSLSEIEEKSGLKSDEKIKVSSPLSGKTYKTGDSIYVTWSDTGIKDYVTTIALVYEDLLLPSAVYKDEDNKNSYKIVVTDEMASGTYFIMLGDLDSKMHFAISNSFTLKTKISKKEIEESLLDARGKASDAAAKANLSNARVQAELYYDTMRSYKNVCIKGTETYFGIKDSVAAAKKATGKKADCDSSATAWAAEVQLKSSKMYYCVDSTGYAKDQSKSKGPQATGCVKQAKVESSSNVNKIIVATFTTNKGQFVIELASDKAPNTVNNFIKLTKKGFYDGQRFHRVIDGFMIQGGDPFSKDLAKKKLWGTGGPGYEFADEFGRGLTNTTGTISMANSGPDTNGSQFFINTNDNSFLDGKHAVFGKVTSGMDVVMQISKVKTETTSNSPLEDVLIKKIEIK